VVEVAIASALPPENREPRVGCGAAPAGGIWCERTARQKHARPGYVKAHAMPNQDIAMSTETTFRAKVRTGAFLFQYGYLDLPTVTDKLQRYANRRGVVCELGQDEVQRILSSAFADIEREPIE
jgi:hypothetical protein